LLLKPVQANLAAVKPIIASLEESPVKTYQKGALILIAGIGGGAAAMEALHAQAAKPPVYVVAEIDVSDIDGYTKDYAGKARAVLVAGGARYLAAGQKVTTLEGEPPKARVVIQVWDSLEKIQAARNSPEYKELRKTGEKYAKFRAFAVEGIAQ
jgi:uncharacterized protein (DUF1330 family)